MEPVAHGEPSPRQLLDLARRDRPAAEQALANLSVDQQVRLVCETPLDQRGRLLGLLPAPEGIVPELPPAELCFTVKAVGLADAAWLLEYTSDEQNVAAVDLDAWQGNELDRATASQWLEAFARTTPEARVRALEALDAEVVTLTLRHRIGVEQKPVEAEGWSPPEGSLTLEGQFHYWALSENDDLADVTALLQPLFESAYWTYFRLMQALIWELESDTEEWALRWRTGRLEDLGFPTWDDSMRVYRHLPESERASLPPDDEASRIEAWALPVWMPQLPQVAGPGERLFRAVAALDEDVRRAVFYAFVSLANRVAVADRMPLGDAESTPTAIEKAAHLASEGLAHLVEANGSSDAEILERVGVERLFRVGANLHPEIARPEPAPSRDPEP